MLCEATAVMMSLPEYCYDDISFSAVMPAHSRSKNGVASLAYVAGIPLSRARCICYRDGRDKPGHDALNSAAMTKVKKRWPTQKIHAA